VGRKASGARRAAYPRSARKFRYNTPGTRACMRTYIGRRNILALLTTVLSLRFNSAPLGLADAHPEQQGSAPGRRRARADFSISSDLVEAKREQGDPCGAGIWS